MEKVYRAAVRAGFAGEFWALTPFETRLRVEVHHEKEQHRQRLGITEAWMTAALHRQKKMPKLEKLLRGGNESKRDMAERLKAAFAALPREEGGADGE